MPAPKALSLVDADAQQPAESWGSTAAPGEGPLQALLSAGPAGSRRCRPPTHAHLAQHPRAGGAELRPTHGSNIPGP